MSIKVIGTITIVETGKVIAKYIGNKRSWKKVNK